MYNGFIKLRLGQEINNQSNKLIEGSLERKETIVLHIYNGFYLPLHTSLNKREILKEEREKFSSLYKYFVR
jgi:hypothetical protein